ncbi:SemiSWEET family sugar transporter [Endothiovibrio diazotrophicus]
MTLIDLLGTAAGTFTTIAFVPQVVKTWRTRSGEDISNGVTLVLALAVIVLKYRYRSGRVGGGGDKAWNSGG